MLDVVLTCLAEGPDAASANLVARRAGVTWGTMQHQFGDVDGLWAAVLEHAAPAGPLLGDSTAADVAVRVREVVDLLWAGLDLPWSCRGGMCCTCRAKVTDGAVEMATNYSLQPWETEAGFVLTCQSHPTTERLGIDYDAA